MKRIYLDNNSTTALSPQVRQAIVSHLDLLGNPSSQHAEGRAAHDVLTRCRENIASYFQVSPEHIVFTSCATEGLNALLWEGFGPTLSSSVEHAAVYAPLSLRKTTRFVDPDSQGRITLEAVKKAWTRDIQRIALMAASNETGVIHEWQAIAEFAAYHSIPYIMDAVAYIGKEAFTIPSGVSAMVISGHKIHAPKGIGCVILKDPDVFHPLIFGGAQEMRRRAGTENLLGIVGLSAAIDQLASSPHEQMRKHRDLLASLLPKAVVNGKGERVSNTLSVQFPPQNDLVETIDSLGIAASKGSACSSQGAKPSRILLNMGLSLSQASSSIRFSLSRYTSEQEVREAAKRLQNLF